MKKHKAKSPLCRNERGFTLDELIVVMVILGLLAALVGPRIFGKVEKAKYNAAKTGQTYDCFSEKVSGLRSMKMQGIEASLSYNVEDKKNVE
jgi:prepilin-type N-terminal cleavage/methylation domain-containing protein